MKKQPEVTAATRQAFLEAFCLLSRQKPIEKITVRELTLKAGYNRCTFYQYFKDVYDLLDYIEDSVISHVKENFRTTITQENFSQTFFDAFTRIQQEKAEYFSLLLSPAHRGRFTEKLTAGVLPTFMERFGISEDNPNASYLANIYLATVIAAISYWISCRRSLPLAELSRLLSCVLTNGIMSEIAQCKK